MSRNYCCGCSSPQHHCSQCACVKYSLSCRNCRKGNECKNPFNSNYKDESRKVEALERRKQKPDDSAKESSSRKAPETIRDVKGDGNCFFRCISVFLNGDEDKHEDIRRNVVETLRDNKDRYKHLVDGDFDTHIQNMSKATGSRNSWATEAELCATSET